MPRFKFDYKNKTFDIEVKECKSFLSKISGLMFRKKSPCLLFYFDEPNRYRIHSFFCEPFIAIWFNGRRIIDVEYIESWRFLIRPKEKVDRLLEIPCNNYIFKEFLDEAKI